MKRRELLAGLPVVAMGSLGTKAEAKARAEVSTNQNDTLVGVTGFIVTVIDGSDSRKSEALDIRSAALKTKLELRLRSFQIPVTDLSSLKQWNAELALIFQVDVSASGNVSVVYTLAVKQPYALPRNSSKWFHLPTWTEQMILVGSSERIRADFYTSLDEMMDKLVNAYLAKNPRKPSLSDLPQTAT